ncbi:hypothetical protein [Rhodovulum euryhalinum]|uniref:Uncharacterized protein n=1 Tax=Rhodovulum euryhalinum TaxID=35805 RepID=A0A4R2K9R4_9RHOB|nr:hypothetical protein [Rhodovulum euryhalinum]TCO70153.1 hypothetical protein EV655_11195 [Rhodovulum euryhalinum]
MTRHRRTRRFLAPLLALAAISFAAVCPANELMDQRNRVREGLRDLRQQGYVMPEIGDMETYDPKTIAAADAIMAGQGDPCLKAISTSLYLDAHMNETSLEARVTDFLKPGAGGLGKQMFDIWIWPDEYAKSGTVLDMLSFRKSANVVGLIGDMANLASTYDAFVEQGRRAAAMREEAWVQEVVQQSIDNKWDEATVDLARSRTMDRMKRVIDTIPGIEADAESALATSEDAYRVRLSMAESNYEVAVRQVETSGASGPTLQIKLANARNAFVAEKQEILEQRAARFAEIMGQHDRRLSDALLAIAKARVQINSIERYSRPIALGRCDKIKKTGPLDKGRPCAPGDVICQIADLPHDQMLATLKALNVPVSEEFLGCVCHRAGYGSPGTAQYYHPDTIGEYDRRYSCNHPGPPCIVSGYGCTRHDMPNSSKIWKGCALEAAKDGSVPVTDRIVEALRARAGVK